MSLGAGCGRSTLFGWYFFAGAFWSDYCAMSLVASVLRGRLVQHTFSLSVYPPTYAADVFRVPRSSWVYLLFAQYFVICRRLAGRRLSSLSSGCITCLDAAIDGVPWY